MSTFSAAHRRRVCSLYRRALKLSYNWAVDRRLWRLKATRIQAEFRRNAVETNAKRVAALVAHVESELERHAHPDPYIHPYRPGGSKYQRNVPPDASFTFKEYPSERHSPADVISRD
mmetsp:Transcript_19532/g.48034  ORF Transcript_19532/g.48034 Transcript_19532/m.48034 type:complete len:117 (+) Transcript_19532:41-391(+)